MPVFKFTVWSAEDLGYSSMIDLFSAGASATIPTDPEPSLAVVNDDDPLFQDGSPDNGQDVDSGTPQRLVQDLFIDGNQVGTAGDTTYVAYSMVFTNMTTDQIGTILVMTVGGYRNDNIVGFVTDVVLNPGDTVESAGPNAMSQSAEIPFVDLICFAKGTSIETCDGPRDVADLKRGDLIKTATGAFQPIRWIGCKHLNFLDLLTQPHLRPIRICSNVGLLDGLTRDISVSPQHRFQIQSYQAELCFGAGRVLVPAKALLGQSGVTYDFACTSVDYFHLLFDEHELIYANGALAESLHLNDRSKYFVNHDAQEEFIELFPDFFDKNEMAQTVLPCITLREAQVLMA